jgi:hypothetical protein
MSDTCGPEYRAQLSCRSALLSINWVRGSSRCCCGIQLHPETWLMHTHIKSSLKNISFQVQISEHRMLRKSELSKATVHLLPIIYVCQFLVFLFDLIILRLLHVKLILELKNLKCALKKTKSNCLTIVKLLVLYKGLCPFRFNHSSVLFPVTYGLTER